jgi:hypothetical protein
VVLVALKARILAATGALVDQPQVLLVRVKAVLAAVALVGILAMVVLVGPMLQPEALEVEAQQEVVEAALMAF